ncbi:hypothetical protein D3C77_470090 [compost metagenome]
MANAEAKVKQYSNNNTVNNFGSTNSALMSNSANNGSGNMGINVAAGDLNQQKNTMAIANTNAPLGNATATASADQDGPNLVVNNNADRTYRLDTITLTKESSGSSSFVKGSALSVDHSSSSSWEAAGKQSNKSSGSVAVDVSGSQKASLNAALKAGFDASQTVTHEHGWHEHSTTNSVEGNLNASLDVKAKSEFEKSFDASFNKKSSSEYEKSGSQASKSELDVVKLYGEASAYEMSNSVSFQILTPTGWANPVTNTATLSGSVNGGSGNLGVNVASGVGNQQSNSLAISNNSF